MTGRDYPELVDQGCPAEGLHVAGDDVRGEPGDQLLVGPPQYGDTSPVVK